MRHRRASRRADRNFRHRTAFQRRASPAKRRAASRNSRRAGTPAALSGARCASGCTANRISRKADGTRTADRTARRLDSRRIPAARVSHGAGIELNFEDSRHIFRTNSIYNYTIVEYIEPGFAHNRRHCLRRLSCRGVFARAQRWLGMENSFRRSPPSGRGVRHLRGGGIRPRSRRIARLHCRNPAACRLAPRRDPRLARPAPPNSRSARPAPDAARETRRSMKALTTITS